MLKKNIAIKWLIAAVSIVISGCGPFFYQPVDNENVASLGPETMLKKSLLNLPQPKEPIVVAVYKFQDQTGQYKPSNVGSSWSTAVTQGATNILVRALEESGWFIPIERENISNLLNERKIIRSSREQYEGNTGKLLPPLLFAGVLLEGGIVSYETNTMTGGAGVRYFGTDVSAQYREDRVSIYLRAVSTSNGKILKTIYTTKSILSQEVSAGIFRYVKYKRLLEAEVGYTYNEPTELAITEAIEKAVQSMIIEGVLENLWQLENPKDLRHNEIKSYLEEKEAVLDYDAIGRPYENKYNRKGYSSVFATGQTYHGDYFSNNIMPGTTLNGGFQFGSFLYIDANFGWQRIEIPEILISQEYYSDVGLLYQANKTGRINPFVSVGIGSTFDFGKQVGISDKYYLSYLTGQLGCDYMINSWFAISSRAYINRFFTDEYDGVSHGNYNDLIWGAKIGLKIYW